MIAFGICIGTEEKYKRFAWPSIVRHSESDSLLLESRDNTSIFPAYNEILEAAAGADDLEALILMHEDVEVRDPDFFAKVRAALEEDIAVVGVTGARRVTSLAWWDGEAVGRCDSPQGVIAFPGVGPDVETVDGLMLVLSPWAVRNLRFDAENYHGFHGYDADICFTARAHGKRVVVADIDVNHHTKGGYGDVQAYLRADATFIAKWGATFVQIAVGSPSEAPAPV